MNLTLVKELLSLYKTEPNIQNIINEEKLILLCEKIKFKLPSETKNSRLTGSQLPSVCWNLLVQINRNNSVSFSTLMTFLQTSKVVLSCAKIIESSQGNFKMGHLDLEKMVANLIAKLSEGIKISLDSNDNQSTYIINLMEFFFERLQKHFNSIEGGMRRMSLVELPSIEDPFVDIKFNGLSPDNTKDLTLKQLTIVALESLCRISLIFQKGHIENILDTLKPFHLNSGSQISHFISNICKLEFFSSFEWKFWNWICQHEIYKQHLIFFKKRCHLKLSPPISTDKLSMKIVAAVLTSEQLTDEMIEGVRNDEFVDEVVGPCLNLLLKEENHIYIQRIEVILSNITFNSVSEPALRNILSSLDSLRNNLFHLIRNNLFITFLEKLNDYLLRINFPVKFYISWTSQVLKAVVENRKQVNQVKGLTKALIVGLMEHKNIPDDMKPKIDKIISQSLSVSSDVKLLRNFILLNSGNIGLLLESSTFNLPQDYFNELSQSVFSCNSSESLLVSWIKVLSAQVNVSSKAFECENIIKLHFSAKLISTNVFDQFKLDHYLDLIYEQIRKLGCSEDTIVLSKQLLTFKNPKLSSSILNNYKFDNRCLQSIVNSVKLYHETGSFSFEVCDFSDLQVNNDIEADFYFYFLNLIFIRGSSDKFRNVLLKFEKFNVLFDRMMHLFRFIDGNNSELWIETWSILEIHSHYKKGNSVDALKFGYEKLKSLLKLGSSGVEKTLETIELIIYLHRLSITTGNISESRYFLKQMFQLADSLKSENIKLLADSIQKEFLKLTGDSKTFIDYLESEKILKSPSFKPFYNEFNNLVELDKARQRIKENFSMSQYQMSCNGFKIKSFNDSNFEKLINENLKTSLEHLKIARDQKAFYFIKEWAKISLFYMYHKSFKESCDLELLNLFELIRNPNIFGNVCLNRLKGSIGILQEQFLSIIWIFIVNFDSNLLIFKINILDRNNFNIKIQKIHEICSQNTDSLRNTIEIAKEDSSKKAEWWKLRKFLDSELISSCSDLNEEIFSTLSEILIPNTFSSLTAKNLHIQLNDLISKYCYNENIFINESFVGQFIQLGKFPKRQNIENFIKFFQFSLKISNQEIKFLSEEIDFDSIILKIRKCFENSFTNYPFSLKYFNPIIINLCLDKDLNIIPFESFPIFKKFIFKRIPIFNYKILEENFQSFEKVFYIINPSGDLIQTQERFENLFKVQPNWNGVIGRKPTIEEFFNGICGIYDLFIYFGHSSGEIYAPLKELKSKLFKRASSALLIGCSSGRIKSNGIFPSESSIFHYLENGSPLILANLWDVTDKDIDSYIKGVLEDSDLLIPIDSENPPIPIQTTANYMTLIEKAHSGRQRCLLKALNGFAPIVYALI